MILTVTLNPCLDKSFFVKSNVPIETLRPVRVVNLAGGKGVNAARALVALGEPVLTLMPLGGHPGAETAELARAEELQPVVVPILGRTRIALTVQEEDTGAYWHYLEPGPDWTAADSERVQVSFRESAARCEFVALCGSLPCQAAEPMVAWMTETARALGCRVALDSHGPGLKLGLTLRPWLAKPNRDELSTVLGRPLASDADAWHAVRAVAASGIAVVLLSAGAAPLLASWGGDEWEVLAPQVPTVNALGCGDSLLAGILAAVRRGLSPSDALRWGVACGAANASVWDPGGIRRADVERLLPAVLLRRPTV
jgi:1-phosphofructokinase family hexose kinase